MYTTGVVSGEKRTHKVSRHSNLWKGPLSSRGLGGSSMGESKEKVPKLREVPFTNN